MPLNLFIFFIIKSLILCSQHFGGDVLNGLEKRFLFRRNVLFLNFRDNNSDSLVININDNIKYSYLFLIPEQMCSNFEDKIPVFVSSTMEELKDERLKARDIINSFPFLSSILFEDFGAKPFDSRTAYIEGVEKSNIVVGILFEQWSEPTIIELKHALTEKKDVLLFIKKTTNADQKILDFIEEIKTSSIITYKKFENEAEFEEYLKKSLMEIFIRDYRLSKKIPIFDINNLMSLCKNNLKNEATGIKGNILEKSTKKYIVDLYIDRLDIKNQIFNFLSDDQYPIASIVGMAGVGKTNFMYNLAEQLLNNNYPTLFLNGALIQSDIEKEIISKFESISPDLVNFTSLIENVSEITKEAQPLVIVIDAINENINPNNLKINLTQMILKKIGSVKIIISCRDIDWNYFIDNNESLKVKLYSNNNIKDYCLPLGNFTESELELAWVAYSKTYNLSGTFSTQIKDLCRHPLLLRFLSEGFENSAVPRDINRREIFDKYWEIKISNTGVKDLAKMALFDIISLMIERKKTELPLSTIVKKLNDSAFKLESPLNRLLSEGLIIYSRQDAIYDQMVGFSYEAFFEYIIAKKYIEDWADLDDEEVKNRFIQTRDLAKDNRILRGSLEYLILFEEEVNDSLCVDLILLCEGERSDFEIVACNSISKLSKIDEEKISCLQVFIESEFVETVLFAKEVFIELQYKNIDMQLLLESWADDPSDFLKECIGSSISRLSKIDFDFRLNIIYKLLNDNNEFVILSTINSLSDMITADKNRVLPFLYKLLLDKNKKLVQYSLRAILITNELVDIAYFDYVKKVYTERKNLDELIAATICVVSNGSDEAFNIMNEITDKKEPLAVYSVHQSLIKIFDFNPIRSLEIINKTIDIIKNDRMLYYRHGYHNSIGGWINLTSRIINYSIKNFKVIMDECENIDDQKKFTTLLEEARTRIDIEIKELERKRW